MNLFAVSMHVCRSGVGAPAREKFSRVPNSSKAMPSRHDPFSAAFIANIAESRFSAHTAYEG